MAGDKDLTFTWEQVISPDFAGWHLHVSETSGGPYAIAAEIIYDGIEQPEYTSTEPITAPKGQTTLYYFVMSAFDNEGNESGFSNEVSTVIDFESPSAPFSLTITVQP